MTKCFTIVRDAAVVGLGAIVLLLFDLAARYGLHDDAGIGQLICHGTLRNAAYGELAMRINGCSGYFRPFQGRQKLFAAEDFRREVQAGTRITFAVTNHPGLK